MQAVESVRAIAQQEGRGTFLPGLCAAAEERPKRTLEALVASPSLVPAIRDMGQVRIEGGSKRLDQVGKRACEVAVLPLAKAMTRHVDRLAKAIVFVVEGGRRLALPRREQARDPNMTLRIEHAAEALPIEGSHSGANALARGVHAPSVDDRPAPRKPSGTGTSESVATVARCRARL